MTVEEKLQEMKIDLPPATAAVGAFVPFVRIGNLVFLSGHIAKKNGKPWTGRLGAGTTTDEGRQAARAAAIDAMGTLNAAVGGNLENVKRIVKLLVLVASEPGFTEQHLVANGASELLAEIFGEKGAHARSAFGIVEAPLGSCVELEMVVEVK